ncbi:MAG: NADH-quinone oxidoreductase subunit L [Bdellovibrionales bacterium]
MTESFWLALIILAPLVGFIVNGVNFRSKNYKVAGMIGTLAVGLSFVSAVSLFGKLISLPEAERVIRHSFFDWIVVGDLKVQASFLVDQISGMMILIITGVGTLIHIFSIGYMSHDERPSKYFAYLNLFVVNMLLLVLGENLLVLFVGWEGVGLCSYLLIGFWFTDKEKAAAGMKAFITNRIGDAGLLIGMFLLFYLFGTLSVTELLAQAPFQTDIGFGLLTLACIALFVGATGKSAQIPLYVWLPDAMAGPTPVSALIHAATMVTAGIYMIVRLNPLFMAAPIAMEMIAWIGALTAFFAATIGITQWDIKKILAYSTVSQLGYMFLALGVGSFNAAMFHLMTHAFFKALMFLGSGSVIHAMGEEQDIRKMGGLKKYMPITHITFVLGWLAIIGMPPFAGFFSKDEILWMSWHSPMGSKGLWFIGWLAAGMTAFYMTRLMALTFWGKSRVAEDVHPHESPVSMTFPLIVLAVLSVVGGWIGIPHVIGDLIGHVPNVLEHWLSPKLSEIPGILPPNVAHEYILMSLSVGLAGISSYFAYTWYTKKPEVPEAIANRFKGTYELINDKYRVDELYQRYIIQPSIDIGKGFWAYIDVSFIDKITYWLSDFIKESAGGLRMLQSGNLQQYAFYIVLGIISTISYLILG